MKIPKKRVITLAIIMTACGMGAAFAYHNFGHGEHRKPSKYESELATNGTEIVVRAFRIPSGQDTNVESSFTGTLQPRYQTPVGFRIAGKIASRHVEVGSQVKKGDLLFSLDPVDFELNLRVAEADLVSARSTLIQASAEEERLRQLRTSNSVSLSDYDAGLANRDVAQARLDSALKRLELAQNQLQYCELKADCDGLVTSIQGESGQVVNIGQTVLQLMRGTELEVVVSLPENRVGDVRNLKPNVSFWSHPNLRTPAELRELSPIADPISRTYDAKFRLLEPVDNIAIGMTATVYLSDESKTGVVVPTTAIANEMNKPVVWKIVESDGSVTAIPIEVLHVNGNTTTVQASLYPNDLIVSAGVQRVDADVKVRVWNPSN